MMLKKAVFANLLIATALVFLGLIFVCGLVNYPKLNPAWAITVYILILASMFALRPIYRVKLALTIVSATATLYTLEVILMYKEVATLHRSKSKELGIDTRSWLEVLKNLRQDGLRASLAVWPRVLLTVWASEFERLLPLSGISNVATVLCNETGEWVIYESDEHGFNNPKGLYKPGDVDIVAVGDSFIHGFCVRPERNAVGLLRDRFPKTLNLGMGGNGPLANLATFREYVEPLKPKLILWSYTANTLNRVSAESANPFLSGYLKNGYSHGLLSIQPELDRVLTRLEPRYERANRQPRFQTLLLRRLGHRISLAFLESWAEALPSQTQYELLREILVTAIAAVNSWEGQLYFVYLPGYESTCGVGDHDHGAVVAIARELQIGVIDLCSVFHSHPDPRFLFPFGRPGHYNEEGYKLVADTILRSIEVPEKIASPGASSPARGSSPSTPGPARRMTTPTSRPSFPP